MNIQEYPLTMTDPVTLPIGAELLSVEKRGHRCLLVALVNPAADTEQRLIVHATIGDDIPIGATYIGGHYPHYFFDGGAL